jgi:cytohesin
MAALVSAGADVNAENDMGSVPLHFAAGARARPADACRLLLAAGAAPGVEDVRGQVPWMAAADDELAHLLGGPDPALYAAAGAGDVRALRALLADPALDPTLPSASGVGAAHLAAAGGHVGALSLLLARAPALADARDAAAGEAPAHHAARGGHAAALELLARRGADLAARSEHNSEYARGEWSSKSREAIEPAHATPLHLAVEGGHAAAAAALLAAGAPPDAPDFEGRTPLHRALEAALEGDEEAAAMAELLLKAGADAARGTSDFASALHLVSGDAELIKLLAAHGADANVADAEGWTALMLSARRGGRAGSSAAAALLAAGAAAGATNAAGATALHLAAANGRLETARALLAAAPALKAARNSDGKTPAELAKAPELAALLA